MQIVLFEDERVQQLDPITLMRPAYTIGCAAHRLVDWALRFGDCVRGVVRPHLNAWQRAECPEFCGQADSSAKTLLINARVAPLQRNYESLAQLARDQQPRLLMQGECLVAGLLPSTMSLEDSPARPQAVADLLLNSAHPSIARSECDIALLDYPHQVIQYHLQGIVENLNRRIESDGLREVRDGVFAKRDSPLDACIHTDTTNGPVVIDEHVTIRPFACLNGPVYLGPHSRVNEHAVLKNGVAVGAHCRVGGEIGASVIESYSNKQHHGYLGHAYVGQWVNLGAGTSNSNLKNTYGTIRMDVDGEQVETGMQFMGCVIGDYTKSAINTSIFTGKLIGVCSALYGFVTTNAPSFANYARSFGQLTEINPPTVALMQRRAFARRGLEQKPWHVQLLQDVYQRVAAGRELADEPVSL